jgi:hypothetical protein
VSCLAVDGALLGVWVYDPSSVLGSMIGTFHLDSGADAELDRRTTAPYEGLVPEAPESSSPRSSNGSVLPQHTQLVAILILSARLVACNATSCDEHDTITEITTGDTSVASLSYASAPWDNMDRFGAGEALDFVHGLGVVPQSIQSFVSFEADSSSSENAGSQGSIECVDEERVRLRNTTCQDFYVRVVIQAFDEGDSGRRPCD